MELHRVARAFNFSVLITLIGMLKTGFSATPPVFYNIWAQLIQLLLQLCQRAKYMF